VNQKSSATGNAIENNRTPVTLGHGSRQQVTVVPRPTPPGEIINVQKKEQNPTPPGGGQFPETLDSKGKPLQGLWGECSERSTKAHVPLKVDSNNRKARKGVRQRCPSPSTKTVSDLYQTAGGCAWGTEFALNVWNKSTSVRTQPAPGEGGK